MAVRIIIGVFQNEPGVDVFAFRSDFELNFRNPKKYSFVATGQKVSQTTDGKESVTLWKSEMPLAAAGFAFGDYKIYTEEVGDVEVQLYANNQPDDLLKSIQQGSTVLWKTWPPAQDGARWAK